MGLLCPFVQLDRVAFPYHDKAESVVRSTNETGTTWILHVYVSDRLTHSPIEGADVSVDFGGGDYLDLRTDRRGYVAHGVLSDLPAVITLSVEANGYRTETYRIQVLSNLSYAAPMTPIGTSAIFDGPSSPFLVVGIIVGAVVAWISVSWVRKRRKTTKKKGGR